ncbi:MAG: cadherin-like domain-containing protein [Chromatiales bacterium]|nr:cadherin-like domain-containing protein [Chromatiales bacterium]
MNVLENASVIIDVAANDTATLPATLNLASVAIVTQPLHGTLGANTGGTVSYAPALNFSGADGFVYVIEVTPTASCPITRPWPSPSFPSTVRRCW